MSQDLHILACRVAAALTAAGQSVTVAESCTGGWIARTLTDVAGSSAWFEYGFVCYGDRAKQTMIGVDPALIEAHGAVSRPVAEAMARGAQNTAGADWAVAVTGIAGPGGGSADKPVGTVWLAWAGPGRLLASEARHFDGNRRAVRCASVAAALSGLLSRMKCP